MLTQQYSSLLFAKRLTLSTVAAVALWSFSGQNAYATCGDYLDFSHQMTPVGPSAGQDHTMAGDERPWTPCSGPSCRENRNAPATPPVPVPVPESVKLFGMLADWARSGQSSRHIDVRLVDDRLAVNLFAGGIFRPPEA